MTLGPKALDFFCKMNEILQVLDIGYRVCHFCSYCVILHIFTAYWVVLLGWSVKVMRNSLKHKEE